MKALSVTQPWATLLANGAKHIETRSWSTPHRGWTAIHASKGFPGWAKRAAAEPEFIEHLRTYPGVPFYTHQVIALLPLGAVIAVGNLHKVGQILRRRDGAIMARGQELPITGDELLFGDFSDGRFGWVFTNTCRLPEPVPATGKLGLWDWQPPAELQAWLKARGVL